jgi:tetratricopeptide (TPR) repeat protein
MNESIEAFNNALGNDPDYEKARYNLGRAYLKQGDRDQAEAQYNILRSNRSDWADRLYVLINP